VETKSRPATIEANISVAILMESSLVIVFKPWFSVAS
jgi:hypothetical protein